MVYIFNKGDDFGNWLIVDYENEKKDLLTGYIHNSRLKNLESYEEIPSVITDENGANFLLRNIVVEIKTGKFDFKKNEKYFTRNKGTNYFEKYKGQNFWGFNTSIPKTFYKSISVNIGQKKIEIPKKEIENFFEVNNELTKVFYDAKTDTLYIISSNADGSDSYYVLFMIKNGKYSGRKAYSAN